MSKLLSREDFKTKVFDRDHSQCVICKKPAVDAHHILDRKLFDDGGYYLDNGSSVCEECHILAEKTLISVEEIRSACGIINIVVPKGWDSSLRWDKWGNQIVSPSQRRKGPLFEDDGAKKILTQAGLYWSGMFTD
jgi:hypothetical protein